MNYTLWENGNGYEFATFEEAFDEMIRLAKEGSKAENLSIERNCEEDYFDPEEYLTELCI